MFKWLLIFLLADNTGGNVMSFKSSAECELFAKMGQQAGHKVAAERGTTVKKVFCKQVPANARFAASIKDGKLIELPKDDDIDVEKLPPELRAKVMKELGR